MTVFEQLQKEIKSKISHDPAHDFDHIMRVYKNAEKIAINENANKKLVLCAVLLHDLVKYPKYDKRSKNTSTESAIKSRKLLLKYNFYESEIQIITDAIRDHSFSKNKIPKTLEGKILQDADRLDAIGAIGIARAFAVSGYENRPFYHAKDPFCIKRKPNDQKWTIDHFYHKLLKLEKLMNTKSAKIEAKKRTRILKRFLSELKDEI